MFKFSKSVKLCKNCGKSNHIHKFCNDPITSYGLITYVDNNKIILVRRKFSFAYIDFMIGKYETDFLINNEGTGLLYLLKLFSRMSKPELKLILNSNNFDDLYNIIGFTKTTIHHKNIYENSKSKFNLLKITNKIFEIFKILSIVLGVNFFNEEKYNININNNTNEIIKEFRNFVNSNNVILYNNPEWVLPKGRRNHEESNLETAIREFYEETDIDSINIFKNIIPLDEKITTLNNKEYKNVYYLSELCSNYLEYLLSNKNINYSHNESDILIDINNDNKNQEKEIGLVGIISLNNIDKYLRNYQIDKKKVIYKSYQMYNNFKLYFES